MLDRDTGPKFDHDPNLDRPLGGSTRQFLKRYYETDEFKHGYNLWNMQFADPNQYSGVGRRRAIWVQSFVNRLFDVQTVSEADRLLEPWIRWGKVHSDIWRPYWNGDHSDEDTSAHYKRIQESFNAVPIPEEIKAYQGNLMDEDLRTLADGLLWMTREIRESIDLTEGAQRPIPLSTVFRVQRIMGKPFMPAGGLEDQVRDKPSIRRIEHEGKTYIAFDIDGEEADFASLDPSSEEEWQRWNQLQVGTRVRYLREDREAKKKTVELGTVRGFDLLGAGDAMLFGPSVANIGIIVTNDQTGFFQCSLVSDIRLDQNQITLEELSSIEPEKPVDVVFMKPQTGEVTQQTFETMEQATDEVKKRITQEFSQQE
ncbi:MAG: hypothetical protein M1142_03585 [Patescibacteria group bacterium]|nr:hypothetical protein [Patescibacteria group bacterium]